MQRNKLIICITAFLLLTSVFAVIPAFSAQPPVDTTTYYIGTIGQPRNVDPALAYDTASGELIFNVAEPLFFFGDHKFLPAETNKINATDYGSLDPATFVPAIAKYMPEVTFTTPGSTWVFQIDTTVQFQDWTDSLGVVHSGQTVTPEDVVYHFQRSLMMDSYEAPTWMWSTPMFGGAGYFQGDPTWDADGDTQDLEPLATNGAGERLASAALQSHIYKSSPTNVTLVFDADWPVTGLYQTFAQQWGAILPMNFCMEHGCWNGTFYDGWSTTSATIGVSNYPAANASPLDRHTARSKYSSASAEPALCGSGPYKFTYWDQAMQQWRIDKFANYHKGWAGSHVDTVIETGVDAWPTRKMMFLQGEWDTCAVPRSNMFDLLDPAAADPIHTPIPGIMLNYGTLGLQNDVMLFDLNMSATGKFVPKANGVPKKDLFGDIHVRRAFASSVNFSNYISGAWYGEADHPASWWVEGLAPDYKNKTLAPWDYSAATMQAEFAAAGITSLEVTLTYNIGNEGRRIFMEAVRDGIKAVMGIQFQCTVLGEDWPTFLTDQHSHQLPCWNVGWLADFADSDNFARTYMYTTGPFSVFQNVDEDPVSPHVDQLVDDGAAMPDGQARNDTYQELQSIYKERAWGIPTIQAVGRGWHRTWVRNLEINQLYPGGYYYFRYKTAAGSLKNIDLDVTSTITPIVSYTHVLVYKSAMRVGYNNVTMQGNASAAKQIFDLHVKRTDAVAGLVAAVIGLKRTNLTTSPAESFAYPNSTFVLLLPAPDPGITVRLIHYESGGTAVGTLPALATGVTWQMAARTDVITFDCQDTNTANNLQNGGTLVAYTANLADINGDGIVDILDAITLAGVYGKKAGDTGWNADANLNTVVDPISGKQIIDILDAITLANNFGKHNQP